MANNVTCFTFPFFHGARGMCVAPRGAAAARTRDVVAPTSSREQSYNLKITVSRGAGRRQP
jgi:hypothetical protein